MTQVAFGVNHITHPLLELLDLGKTAIAFALPEGHAVDQDLEVTAGIRMQIDRAQLLAEGGCRGRSSVAGQTFFQRQRHSPQYFLEALAEPVAIEA